MQRFDIVFFAKERITDDCDVHVRQSRNCLDEDMLPLPGGQTAKGTHNELTLPAQLLAQLFDHRARDCIEWVWTDSIVDDDRFFALATGSDQRIERCLRVRDDQLRSVIACKDSDTAH